MGVWGKGLGRERTPLGNWLLEEGKSQGWLENITGLDRKTISTICGNVDYRPSALTKRTVVQAINNQGFDVEFADFDW
jgi:hypothetical protein